MELFEKQRSKTWRGIPVFGALAVLGGFTLQLTMGSFYSFANMMTYMASYMRIKGSANITYEDFVVVQSTWGMTQGCVMPFAGFIIQLIGERGAMGAGSLLFSLGCGLTYFSLSQELWMVAATYGFVSAFGQNIALIPTLTTAMKWFPTRKGTAMGIVVGGFGGGAMIFNQIQTAIVNPDNISVSKSGPDKGYFTDPVVLERVPNLLLILSGIYAIMGILSVALIHQPSQNWTDKQQQEKQNSPLEKEIDKNSVAMTEPEEAMKNPAISTLQFETSELKVNPDDVSGQKIEAEDENFIYWRDCFKYKEFYILWFTRLFVVLITQVVAALYKAFGQTFIFDDHFLSTVGAVASVFNCSGRLMYGWLMDKTCYKISMSLEAIFLTLLVSTLPLTSYIGTINVHQNGTECYKLENSTSNSFSVATNQSMMQENVNYNISDINCNDALTDTSLLTKAVFALWVWSIFLTFPGTYSMQPAVTIQTFGHRYGGTIYAFLFSSDIVNNLMVATLSKILKEKIGYLGLFITISICGVFALAATLCYPVKPSPQLLKSRKTFSICDTLSNK